jgi:hypothetical protein
MRTFTISSRLLVPPGEFWRVHVSEEFLNSKSESCHWPRTVRNDKMTIFFSEYHHTRTVSQLPEGCEVSDEVSFKPWGSPLGAWLKATEVIRFRAEHSKFKSTYGKA